jgi:hypothetical protein
VVTEQLERGQTGEQAENAGHDRRRSGERLRDVVFEERVRPAGAARARRDQAEAEDGRGDVAAVPPARLEAHVDVADGEHRTHTDTGEHRSGSELDIRAPPTSRH